MKSVKNKKETTLSEAKLTETGMCEWGNVLGSYYVKGRADLMHPAQG